MLPHISVMSRRSREQARRRLAMMHNDTNVDDHGEHEHIRGDDIHVSGEEEDYEDVVDTYEDEDEDGDACAREEEEEEEDDQDYEPFGDDQVAMEEFLSHMFPPIPRTVVPEEEGHYSRAPRVDETRRSRLDEDFEELEAHASLPLFDGAKMSVLSSSLLLLDWQVENHVTNVGMDRLFALLRHAMLPDQNEIPSDRNAAKRIVKKMGMDYEMVHACPNNCTLYFEENAHLTKCPVTTCNAPRYRSDVKGPKVPTKVYSQLILLIALF